MNTRLKICFCYKTGYIIQNWVCWMLGIGDEKIQRKAMPDLHGAQKFKQCSDTPILGQVRTAYMAVEGRANETKKVEMVSGVLVKGDP